MLINGFFTDSIVSDKQWAWKYFYMVLLNLKIKSSLKNEL